jgi:CheY-like chemotaxis protein
MNMPGEDGLAIAPKLQKNAPNAIIALLTANFAERVQDQARNQGLLFIAKPITEEKIISFLDHCATQLA